MYQNGLAIFDYRSHGNFFGMRTLLLNFSFCFPRVPVKLSYQSSRVFTIFLSCHNQPTKQDGLGTYFL
jgi:hypothetical protein